MDVNSRALAMAAAGAAGGVEVLGVEDVFSTFLYTGNGSTQTITNGIDLAGEGGLVWFKYRAGAFGNGHYLYDTARGAGKALQSNLINAETAADNRFTSFNSNGFSLSNTGGSAINANDFAYASWTFRKAEKFFDVVTYTGNGANTRSVSHNLNSTVGMVIIKRRNGTGGWATVNRPSSGNARQGNPALGTPSGLNSSAALLDSGSVMSDYANSATFQVGSAFWTNNPVNITGDTYVAYLFAHDAGGFGDAETDNVVSCGSFTTDGSGNATVNLGWEPQWVMIKRASSPLGLFVDSWNIIDNMRGLTVDNAAYLAANSNNAESGPTTAWSITNTGFKFAFGGDSSATYIYIAIRRGPMKTPESGTEVFALARQTNTTGTFTTNFPVDFNIAKRVDGGANYAASRLTGNSAALEPTSTAAETTLGGAWQFASNTTFSNTGVFNAMNWTFRRAPGFFDVVAWTASASTSITHGLGVTPELIIAKSRSVSGESWTVYTQPGGRGNVLFLNTTNANVGIADYWGTSGPTSTSFGVAASGSSNNAGNMIAYLFATLEGVSKVGSYTGTGTTLDINCGFTAGARFVLIKRTDSSGDWFVWDTARGIIAGNDPYLLLNSTAAEVTNTDFIDPLSSGFQISSTAPAAINASGGSFIFLAIS